MTDVIDTERTPTDWPLQLATRDGVKRGRNLKFHGTKKQLLRHLKMLNSIGTGGFWDVDRDQIPDGVMAHRTGRTA